MSDQTNDQAVSLKLDRKRREFLKKLIAAGFAAPAVATFTIDSLTAPSAMAFDARNITPNIGPNTVPNVCATDVGYVGPGSFQAHLVGGPALVEPLATPAVIVNLGSRVNGEATFTVQGASFATGIQATLTLVNNAVITKAYLIINGQQIPFSNGGVITASSLGRLCDLDLVLNALATGQATVIVQGTFMTQAFTITGPVQPGGVANPVSLVP